MDSQRQQQPTYRVGIVGASGFTGAELLRLCERHPALEVVLATADTQAGVAVGELYPHLAGTYGNLEFTRYDVEAVATCDVVFAGMPHGASQGVVGELIDRVEVVIDLAADFRLRDASLYPQWYGEEHNVPHLLERAVYGLPELFCDQIADAALVAAPGCYPTAATLALAPLAQSGLADPHGVIVDAASGASGAGRAAKDNTTFCAVDGSMSAYGLLDHRHTPEIEQSLAGLSPTDSASVLFTPHLAPMSRGILATCYARPAPGTTTPSTAELLEHYRDYYLGAPFVVVRDDSPNTKSVAGSNSAHVTVRHDERTGWLVALCAIDNLVKGASGQAIQCANVRLGLPEASGLPTSGLYP